ncbi:phenylalanine--tRNA ligase subunit beta [Actinotignum urinale]|uniref:phenylalanine--tRNA ligase subunit beta n=1 Tax=Actinotignum urinale TaxID=190146 RepID=UPI002A815E8E|nr:phenylalanine--tRNA ligase subunit beta [Actinotignum urinale]MDY5128794.1 phenylalanine--tRNA ligase subunit beta [Actinotignum urinale]
MPLISMDWLGTHVELPDDLTAAQLATDLVKVGLEEEEIHSGPITGPLVVGKVLTREAKEQSNGKVINYCRVDVGQYNDKPGTGKEPSAFPSRGIICGAHNFEAGDYVVVALPGAILPGGFAIAARKTYGHISDGMMCSGRELGISEEADGIIVLDPETVPELGTSAFKLLGIPEETLEINVTPDRGYCFSMRGVAREYHHSTGAKFTDRALVEGLPKATADGFPVSVDDNAPIHGKPGCDLFVTRIVRGVDPNVASPKWMRDRLTQSGMRPISLAVDATNYVMLDLGQPLHAYDLDQMRGGIVVRRATESEKLVTLDDVERNLHPEDLLITDDGGARVLGLAGVMGGASTEITDATVNVLIEAAHFDPVSIARTAHRHRLPSEASKRFERGVDPAVAEVAAQRVVDILVEYGGGQAGEEVGIFGEVHELPAVEFPVSEVARLAGLDLEATRIQAILEDIGCSVETHGDADKNAVWTVQPPTWRPDLVAPAHFVEEVARLVGYDEIPSIVPSSPAGHGLTFVQRQRRDFSRTLAEIGWVQVITYPFVCEKTFDGQGFGAEDIRRTTIRLVNPLQDDVALLRTSLLDTLMASASMNVKRGNPCVALYETGHVVRPSGIVSSDIPPAGARPDEDAISGLKGAIPDQPYHVAGVACGAVTQTQAGIEPLSWDWRDAIQAAKQVVELTAVASVQVADIAPWHPGRCAAILANGKVVGYAGELAPAVCRAFEIPARSVAFEIDTDKLAELSTGTPMAVQPVYTTPPAKEDFAFIVDEKVTVHEAEVVIRQAVKHGIEEVRLFDVYTGDQIEDGKKSLAFAVRFRDDHTLNAGETAALRKKIVKAMAKRLKAELRA